MIANGARVKGERLRSRFHLKGSVLFSIVMGAETTVSAVIPTLRRKEHLRNLLHSLANQTLQVSEVIIVDQSPTPDDEQQLMACLPSRVELRYLHNPNLNGLPAARNYGAQFTHSSILLFLDDDITCEKDFVFWLLEGFKDPSVGGVGGRWLELNEPSPPQWLQVFATLFFVGDFRQHQSADWRTQMRGQIVSHVLPGVAAYRREVWSVTRFDERLVGPALGEDIDFSYRAGKKWKLLIETRACFVHHRAAATYRDLHLMTMRTLVFFHYHFRKNMRGSVGQWLAFLWLNLGLALRALVSLDARRCLGILDGWSEIARRGIAYRPLSDT